jgi:hypothetical protein
MPTLSKNLHLAVSAIIIIMIALTYGLFPAITLPRIFNFKAETTDLKEVLRATMCLYLSMATLWLTGIFKKHFWRTATISNVIFMTGLAVGRVISLFIDGIPSTAFLVGLVAEVTLALWGLRNLNKYEVIRNY